MQFTYEKAGNDCWLTVKLTFTKEVILINQQWTGYHSDEHSEILKPGELLEFLSNNNLLVSNFSGLENYLKENYPEVLPKQQPSEKELIAGLVNLIESIKIDCPYFVDWTVYKAAKLYLDPNYNERDNY